MAGSAMLSEAPHQGSGRGLRGATDTAMNVVAAMGAGLAGPLTHVLGFGGLNAAASFLALPMPFFGLRVFRAH
ncbi:hypothetical protein [Streptomyces sp. NPDC004728]|uniref:hypothetical protein n=1 Tax=Streptomyces sp. NPDC004728 TaxID=3154289 RepID=UPI0033B6C717